MALASQQRWLKFVHMLCPAVGENEKWAVQSKQKRKGPQVKSGAQPSTIAKYSFVFVNKETTTESWEDPMYTPAVGLSTIVSTGRCSWPWWRDSQWEHQTTHRTPGNTHTVNEPHTYTHTHTHTVTHPHAHTYTHTHTLPTHTLSPCADFIF